MPRALSADERAILIFYCFDHPVAECGRCAKRFREVELVTDYVRGHTHLCPICHEDLIDSARAHLYGCRIAPEAVRRNAQAAREHSRRLVKHARQLRDDADVLGRESEALVDAIRIGAVATSYRGWRIEPQSYQQSSGDRWYPKAVVRNPEGEIDHAQTVLNRTFTTARDANVYAVAVAKDMIDKRLAAAPPWQG